MLLLTAGAENVGIFETFAGQAYIAIAQKSGAEVFTVKAAASDDASASESAGVRVHI
jgi:hypothetical protein